MYSSVRRRDDRVQLAGSARGCTNRELVGHFFRRCLLTDLSFGPENPHRISSRRRTPRVRAKPLSSDRLANRRTVSIASWLAVRRTPTSRQPDCPHAAREHMFPGRDHLGSADDAQVQDRPAPPLLSNQSDEIKGPVHGHTRVKPRQPAGPPIKSRVMKRSTLVDGHKTV